MIVVIDDPSLIDRAVLCLVDVLRSNLRARQSIGSSQASRAIRTAALGDGLLRVHGRPIDGMVSPGPSGGSRPREGSSWGVLPT